MEEGKVKSYSEIVPLEKYKQDYAKDLREFFIKNGKDEKIVDQYIKDMLDCDFVDDVYMERLEGWESGQYDKFYLDIDWQLHGLNYPDW